MGTTRKFDPSEPVLAHLQNLYTGLLTLHPLFAGLHFEEVGNLDAAIVALTERVKEIERKLIELPAFTLHPLARARLFGGMFDPPYHADHKDHDAVGPAWGRAAAETDDLAVGDLLVDEVVSEHGLRTDRPERERVCVLELAVGPVVKPKRGAWWQAQYIPGESVRVLAGPHRGRTGVIRTVGLMSYEVDLDPVGS